MLKRAEVELEDIALFAGHKDTKTTLLYIRLAPGVLGKRIREKVEPFDARISSLIMQATDEEEAVHAK